LDGFWFVLKGKVRFHFNDSVVDVEPMGGLIVPRDVHYWFESTGDEPLELLQVDAIHPHLPNKINFSPEDEQLM
jgi:mannose-6-phosphate isomerase-like protein (cupin superfamily)